MISCLEWQGKRPAQKFNFLIFVPHVVPVLCVFIVLNEKWETCLCHAFADLTFWAELNHDIKGGYSFHSGDPVTWKGEPFKNEPTAFFKINTA